MKGICLAAVAAALSVGLVSVAEARVFIGVGVTPMVPVAPLPVYAPPAPVYYAPPPLVYPPPPLVYAPPAYAPPVVAGYYGPPRGWYGHYGYGYGYWR
jgi:hypothetical protein